MPNEDRTLWMVFNGEIYNFRELRAPLEAKGHRFRSTSDAEVLLHGYEEYGLDILPRLRGMFAFALFDERKEELFLARDPFGIKPLVYAALPQGFAFASELRVLASLPEFPREIDEEATSFYFRLNYIPAPWTIWKSARKLEPGFYMRVQKGRIMEHAPYYQLPADKWQGSKEDAAEALTEALQQSVKLHLNSDVPLGAFLSGGLDSSLVVAMAQKELKEAVKTFTVTFPEAPHYDESKYARVVAQALDTDHTEIPVTAREAKGTLLEIVDHLDEPFADSSLVPSAIISKLTRRHVKVALSGDGGDELFAGYNKYQGLKLGRLLMPLAPLFRGIARLPLREDRGTLIGDRVRQFRKLANSQRHAPSDQMVGTMEVATDKDLAVLLQRPKHAGIVRHQIEELLREGSSLGLEGINLALYSDARFVLPHDMLFKADTASMRYALEVRVPIVDTDVARLAFSLPSQWKLRGFQRKWILKKVAEPLLPRETLSRPKGGFGIPIGAWIRDDFYQLFRDSLQPKKLQAGGMLNGDHVEAVFQEHVGGKRDRFHELWNVFVFQRWWERWLGRG